MQGIYTALVTPFFTDGSIDEQGLRQYVRYNIDKMGVNGLYVGGSTSESFMMSEDEKKQMFEIVINEAGTDVNLIAQIGSLNINEAVNLGLYAKKLGYQTLSAITPFYYKFDFKEIKAYYKHLVEKTNHPMIIYSNPSFTGAYFSIDDFGELLGLPNVIGVKYTDTNLVQLSALKQKFSDKVFFSGADDLLLQCLISGADGAIGSTYNVLGNHAVQLAQYVNDSKLPEATQLQEQVNRSISEMVNLGVYQSIKEILRLNGLNASMMRFPFKELSDTKKQQVESIVQLINDIR